MTEDQLQREARVMELAAKIELLFGFCAGLLDDMDLVREALEQSTRQANSAATLMPILGAVGMDHERPMFDAELRADRAKALLSLLETLKRTEDERQTFNDREQGKAEARAKLGAILGG